MIWLPWSLVPISPISLQPDHMSLSHAVARLLIPLTCCLFPHWLMSLLNAVIQCTQKLECRFSRVLIWKCSRALSRKNMAAQSNILFVCLRRAWSICGQRMERDYLSCRSSFLKKIMLQWSYRFSKFRLNSVELQKATYQVQSNVIS